jgi:hypothetical protein
MSCACRERVEGRCRRGEEDVAAAESIGGKEKRSGKSGWCEQRRAAKTERREEKGMRGARARSATSREKSGSSEGRCRMRRRKMWLGGEVAEQAEAVRRRPAGIGWPRRRPRQRRNAWARRTSAWMRML